MKKYLPTIIFFVAFVLIFVGFQLASQAGQSLGVIQNDGYAGSGGLLILMGGFLLGTQLKDKKDK